MNSSRALREARRRAGLSQAELAGRVGVTKTVVGRIESGERTPRVDTLDRFLAACSAALVVEPRLGVGIDRGPIRELLARHPLGRIPLRRGFSPPTLLRILPGLKVNFVVIGDAAARLQGAPVDVNRLDIVPQQEGLNPGRLRKALRRLSIRREREGRAVPPLATRGRQLIQTDHGRVVCWWTARELPPYPELGRAATEMVVVHRPVRVAAVEDLTRLARAAGRPSDLERAELLGAVQDCLP